MIRFALILLLTGCSVAPEKLASLTPAECQSHGVAVADSDTITGKIVKSQSGTYARMDRECDGVYGVLTAGCAKAANVPVSMFPSPTGEYEIWYTDARCAARHEACHALYEESNHTIAFNLRRMQGDTLASCPRT